MADWEERLKNAAGSGAAGYSVGGVPGAIFGALFGGLFGGGGGSTKAQNKALQRQTDLATQAMNMQRRQFNVDLPLRANLFQALQARQRQQFPHFMPQMPTYTNPTTRRLKMGSMAPLTGLSQAPQSRGGYNARPRPSGLAAALLPLLLRMQRSRR